MIRSVAEAIAKEMVRQNHMLELTIDDDGVEVYDSYDNRAYDCVKLAEAAMKANDES